MQLIQHLGDFLHHELRQRRMSALAFAEFVGVSHTTISKFLDFGVQDTGYPSVDFLVKLAKATNTDIRYLITLVAPQEVIMNVEAHPDYAELSQQIAKLPPHYRKIIEIIIAAGLSE